MNSKPKTYSEYMDAPLLNPKKFQNWVLSLKEMPDPPIPLQYLIGIKCNFDLKPYIEAEQ